MRPEGSRGRPSGNNNQSSVPVAEWPQGDVSKQTLVCLAPLLDMSPAATRLAEEVAISPALLSPHPRCRMVTCCTLTRQRRRWAIKAYNCTQNSSIGGSGGPLCPRRALGIDCCHLAGNYLPITAPHQQGQWVGDLIIPRYWQPPAMSLPHTLSNSTSHQPCPQPYIPLQQHQTLPEIPPSSPLLSNPQCIPTVVCHSQQM
ncbi:unnamed protein product [Gadus morhua 'NCC']